MNWRAAVVATATLVAGLALFAYATGVVRGLFGDVLIVMLGVSGLASVRVGRPASRIGGVFGLGVLAEIVQALDLVGGDSHWLLHLTVGSTADPLDVVAYAVGAAVSVGLERVWRESVAPSG